MSQNNFNHKQNRKTDYVIFVPQIMVVYFALLNHYSTVICFHKDYKVKLHRK